MVRSTPNQQTSGIPVRNIPCERFIKTMFEQNRDLIRHETSEIKGLMTLLMKHHNTGIAWTSSEKTELRSHLREIARVVPALCIFLLPFGALFLPLLAVAMDRRKSPRKTSSPDTAAQAEH